MGYSAKHIANYFLDNHARTGITHLKIQKLTYLSHGMNYVHRDNDLINDEYAEAWKYGPVFPSLYEEFKSRGKQPIMKLATELNAEMFWEKRKIKFDTPKIKDGDDYTRNLLGEVWQKYGSKNGQQLSALTHQEGSPWYQTRVKTHGARNANIDNKLIKAHFKKMADLIF
ncbi:MAG: DUF4065 domain-containing protein [Rhodobacteraceae bacterium]|nr:DUF4065 domain-containing protein [Paracoccaceae bacterium]